MKRWPSNFWIVLILLAGLSGANIERSFADMSPDKLKSPFQIKVKTAKKTFKINEPIEGTVIIKNTYPATLPALFKIQILRDGRHFSESITSVPAVPFGTTKFTFKNFGVPDFNYGPGTEGAWRINIIQQNTDPSSPGQGVNLRIIPLDGKKEKL